MIFLSLITDFNALLCYDTHNPKEFCPYCMHGYDKRYLKTDEKKAEFEEHKKECFKYGGVKTVLPNQDNKYLKFGEISKQLEHSHCMYADLESTVRKVDDKKSVHEISGYNLRIVSRYFPTRTYKATGADAGAKFVKKIEELSEELYETIQLANAPMIFEDEEKERFKNEKFCHICDDALPKNSTEVDHLEATEGLLFDLGLNLNQIPSWNELNEMKYDGEENSDDHIIWADIKKELMDYLKKNNGIIVRDHDHFTGNIFKKLVKYLTNTFLRSV